MRGVRAAALALLAAAPAGAVIHKQTIDFTGASPNCILNNNLTGRAIYGHGDHLCHPLEASWRGPLFESVWGAPICQQGPNDKTCGQWGSGCCMNCAFKGTDHGPADFNLGKGFIPGTYHETLTVDAIVPGAQSTVDQIWTSGFQLAFSPNTFGAGGHCAIRGAGAPAMALGDALDVTVIIPDVGQSVRLAKDEPDSGDGQEGVVNVPLKPFKVIVTKKVDGGATTLPMQDVAIEFRLKNAGEVVLETRAAQTGPDGRAAGQFTVTEPGDYTVEVVCAECALGSPATFTATIVSETDARVLNKVSGDNQRGFFNERLRNPLVVEVRNRLTGQQIDDVPIDFKIPSTLTCPTNAQAGLDAASLTVHKTQTLQGTAQTEATLRQIPATCQVTAECAPTHCPKASVQVFNFRILKPRDSSMDQGAPGNPLTRDGGGPSRGGGKRAQDFLGIEFRVPELSRNYRLTRPPDGGYIGLLVRDTFNLRVRSAVAGQYSWSGPFSGNGSELTGLSFSAPSGSIDSPVAETVSRSPDTASESVQLLARESPKEALGTNCAFFAEKRSLFAVGVPACANSDIGRLNCLDRLRDFHAAAYRFAERNSEPRGRLGGSCGNNCCDALKHIHWHARAEQLVGRPSARDMGYAHELEGECEQKKHNEVVMDLFNNDIGHEIGAAFPALEALEAEVLRRVRDGRALVLWDTGNVDSNSLLVRSHVCR